ncbi:uncharacterized protein EURHEDRAFT_412591 [Aspergillus ruber CBS 135680]|uniref:Uncharacterized protein n=1 Tax=Aspergillus ruber (strain CBS 135680) TaxID=1388766 RepID=A0A017SCU9_ASPRC|nr:uncharacterized protein EURHEDRAFT_412591 [Aspergillus ruber CBS 135680]EYE94777.1 hypothetical protein EURHEDRAFT_412591 [Aspergillus ruber CBS 135680]
MSINGPSPLPPTTLTSNTPIPQSTASAYLSAYLDRASTDPALQPNASISEHGPVSRTTASAPNLILHNLKRVQAGLAGEVLGRDLTMIRMEPEPENGEGVYEAGQEQERVVEEKEKPVDMEMMEMDGEGEGVDKEERKRKKKERRLAEKKAKARG